MTIDDNVKQKLLNSLSEEPPMVLSTAYAYAKNYVQYGEDITKSWTTAVQQASILEQVKQKAWGEAYDSFKADYNNRLKADMVAMLRFLWNDIENLDAPICDYSTDCISKWQVHEVIQKKINSIKAEIESPESEKINCKTVKCENCINHNYCDFEPQKSENNK